MEETEDVNDIKFLRIRDFKEFLKCLKSGLNVENLKLNGRTFFKDNKMQLDGFIVNENIDNYMDISL